MSRRIHSLTPWLALAALPLLLALGEPVHARAGGGFSGGGAHGVSSGGYHGGFPHGGFGTSGSSSGDVAPIVVGLLVAVFGAFTVMSHIATKPPRPEVPFRSRRAARSESLSTLVPRAAERDPVWREADLLQQAQDVFMAVQNAWVQRDQDLAKDVMTPRLYEKHRAQTDAMVARGEKNVLERLVIKRARIVHLVDRLDDAHDEVWVKFGASAIDYTLDEKTGQVSKGSTWTPGYFSEVWAFKRRGDAWLADAILPGDVTTPASRVEA